MKRVLVLDANQRSALATTRSLGRHGVTVITADESKTALSGCSCFSTQYFQYPSPSTALEQFITTIRTLAIEQNINIILPMTELTTALLLLYRQNLPDIILPCPSLEKINTLSDKCTLMRLAQNLTIPFPKTWFIDNPNDFNVSLTELPYPIVLKPSKSWLILDGKWLHTAVKFSDSPEQAQDILESDPAFCSHPFMLQERVEGTGQGVFALYDNGNPIAFFSHKRLREKPPWGGVSVLSESVEVNPVLLAHAKTLLDSVKWHGIAMVEFKVAADGTPYLMEINTRFWGSLQLSIDAGVDFPWLLYKMACGTPVEPVKNYKTGKRLRWLLGDIDSLYISLSQKNNNFGRKLTAIMQFLTPSPFRTKHEVNRWGDLKPFWWEIKQYFRDLLS